MSDASTSETTADDAAVRERLIASLVRDLGAYRQELKLYPPDHPRLRNRVESLLSGLCAFLDGGGGGTLILKVEDHTLHANQHELSDDDPAARRLNATLRERMIHTLELRSGITLAEIRTLADLLCIPPEDSLHRAHGKLELGPHVEVGFFEQSFGEVDALCEGGGGGDGPVNSQLEEFLRDATNTEWATFENRHLQAIQDAMRDADLVQTVMEVSRAIGEVEEGRGFLSTFFDVLRRDPRTDWTDVMGLRCQMKAALELLARAKKEFDEHGSLSTGLLRSASGAGDALGTELCWRLLRGFFPEISGGRSPRESEDLSYIKEGVLGRWEESHEQLVYRSRTCDLEWLSGEFATAFDESSLLSQHTGVVCELVRLSSHLTGEDLRDYCLKNLKGQIPTERKPLEEIVPLLLSAQSLPEELRLVWAVEILRRASQPEDILDALTQYDGELRRELLAGVFDLDVAPQELPTERGAVAMESLRMLLAGRDELALDILCGVFAELGGEVVQSRWPDLLRRVCDGNERVVAWMKQHSEELVRPASHGFVGYLTDDLQRVWVDQLRVSAPHRLQAMLRSLTALTTDHGTRLIELALDLGHPGVRADAIRALGRQQDDRSFELLERMIHERQRSGECQDIDDICAAIAEREDRDGALLLEHVIHRRRWLVPVWRAPIRRAATAVLQSAMRR